MARFFNIQLWLVLIGMSFPTVAYLLVLMERVDPLWISNIAMPMMLLVWIMALALPFCFPRCAPYQHRYTATILVWLFLAVVFPLSWDLTWAIFHEWVNGATSDDKWKWYFWAYAVADTRFLISDPLMIWVEYWSGLFAVVLAYIAYLFVSGKLRQSFIAFTAIGLMQFYATGVFFGVELLQGLSHIRPDVPSYIKFFGLNGMWMIMPAIVSVMLLRLLRDPDYDSRLAVRALFSHRSPG